MNYEFQTKIYANESMFSQKLIGAFNGKASDFRIFVRPMRFRSIPSSLYGKGYAETVIIENHNLIMRPHNGSYPTK